MIVPDAVVADLAQPIGELIAERLTEPLGMTGTATPSVTRSLLLDPDIGVLAIGGRPGSDVVAAPWLEGELLPA